MSKPNVRKLLSEAARARKARPFDAANLFEQVRAAFPANKQARDGLLALRKTARSLPNANPPAMQLNTLKAQIDGGQAHAALAACDALMRQHPYSPALQSAFAELAISQGDYEAADQFHAGLLALYPDQVNILLRNAFVRVTLGRDADALARIEQALALAPDHTEARLEAANILATLGDKQTAFEHCKAALAVAPRHVQALRSYVTLQKVSADDPNVSTLLAMTQDDTLSAADKRDVHYAVFKAHLDTGAVEQAFDALKAAKGFDAALRGYSFAQDEAVFDGIEKLSSTLNDIPALERDLQDHTPVFVVGMPRSGTTLTEQILGAHPQVSAGGELNFLNKLLHPFAGGDRDISADELADIRAKYFNGLRMGGFAKGHLVDKMPTNFRWIPVIRKAFPDAAIIHMTRSPKAVCWSIAQRFFPELDFSSDLAAIGKFYARYEKLMAACAALSDPPFYQSYEALTEDPEQHIRQMLEVCGLPWDPACLTFQHNEGAVRTASALQVKQGIYKGSSVAWEIYADQINALFDPHLNG